MLESERRMNIDTITIQHTAPIYELHTKILSRAYPVCICGAVRAVFNDEGSVTLEIDEEETSAGSAYVTVWGVTP